MLACLQLSMILSAIGPPNDAPETKPDFFAVNITSIYIAVYAYGVQLQSGPGKAFWIPPRSTYTPATAVIALSQPHCRPAPWSVQRHNAPELLIGSAPMRCGCTDAT